MNSIRLRRGFTLIELLVVIAIIGILAALIIVSLTGARARAADTQKKSNARSIDTALAQYYIEQTTASYPAVINSTNLSIIPSSGNNLCQVLVAYMSGTGACTNYKAADATKAKYNVAGTGNTHYSQGWELESTSDTALNAATVGTLAVNAGNGVQVTNSSGQLAGSGSYPALYIGTYTFSANSKVFVTFGPQ